MRSEFALGVPIALRATDPNAAAGQAIRVCATEAVEVVRTNEYLAGYDAVRG